MRILKRNLAFVLALVMALSLTVSAMGVEDYSDVNEIAFVEAVDVMTEMGILEGTDGEFNPTKVLNRAEAAKIIAYMLLGKNAADNLQAVTAPFADVPAKHWAAGYIAHCVNEGIINGVSATEYNPNGELTATAFAKMLLSAVGYNVNGEFTGARWETEVNALALKLGVFDGNLGADLGAGCTREEAALYAFNTLMNIDTVKYSELFGTYYSGTSVLSNEGAMTLNEELYDFDKKADQDAFGREGYVWVNAKNKEVTGLYGDEADAVYTAEVKSGTIYADLGLSEKTQATLIVDGEEVVAGFQLKKSSTTKLAQSGNGVLVEAYVDEDDNVTIVVINTFLAKVTSATEDGEVKVEVYVSETTDNDFDTEVEYAKNDYVLVTVADNKIQSMVAAESVIGELDSVASKYIKLDGEKYNKSKNLDESQGSTTFTPNYTDTMAVILDEYGYAIGLVVEEEVNEIDGYVWVEKAQVRDADLFVEDAALVKVMHLDGSGYEVLPMATKTENNVTKVQRTSNGTLTWAALNNELVNVYEKNGTIVRSQFYGYYMNDDEQIVLVDLDNTEAIQVLEGKVEFKKAQKGVFGTEETKIMNSASELVLVTDESADTTTGYKNINISEDAVNALMLFDGKIIETVYVIDGEAIESDIYAYYNGEHAALNTAKTKFSVTLYVDGEPVEYTLDTTKSGLNIDVDNASAKGIYVIAAEDTDLTAMTKKDATTVAVSSASDYYFAKDDSTVLDNRYYYAEDVKVYDIYNLGGEAGEIAKYDEVTFIYGTKDGKSTGLVAYAYIIGYNDGEADVENDGDTAVSDEHTMKVEVAGNKATITVTGKMGNADGVAVMMWKDNKYSNVGYAQWNAEKSVNGVNVYEFTNGMSSDYEFAFKLMVNDKAVATETIMIAKAQ